MILSYKPYVKVRIFSMNKYVLLIDKSTYLTCAKKRFFVNEEKIYLEV